MTDRAVFSDAEWGLLVRLPQWVVSAASAAQADGGRRSAAEEEVGLLAVANGRESGHALVAELAGRLVDIFDEPDPDAVDFADAEAGIATVCERAQAASRLLGAKAAAAAASVYGGWLLTIVDAVTGAVRSGAVLGVGGDSVSEAERRFRDRLAAALQG